MHLSPFCTVPGGQTQAPVGPWIIGARQAGGETHFPPLMNVPGGHIQAPAEFGTSGGGHVEGVFTHSTPD
jgi:hypothetical protein